MVEIIEIIFLFMVSCDLCLLLVAVGQRWRVATVAAVQISSRIVIVLPVFKEEQTISDAIRFLKCFAYDRVDQIVIVGNARERDENGRNNTLDIAVTAVAGMQKISVIECNVPGAIKAHQVNFAVGSLQHNPFVTWVYVMDVDTRFREENLDELLLRVEQGHLIIQQHTHFLRGQSQARVLGKLVAAYQSRWTLTHEIPRILLFNLTRIGMYHLVGHGLCINLAKFRDLGGFSEEFAIEDVHLGYLCTLLGEPVFSCHRLEESDSPNTLKEWWWQQYGWSTGVMRTPAYFARLVRQGFRFTPYNYVQHIYAIWNYVRWLMNSAAVWFVVTSVGFGFGWHFVIAFMSLYATSFAASAIFLRRHNYYRGSIVAFVMAGISYSFIRSAPVLHGFIDTMLGIQRRKYKTEHVKIDA